MWQRFRKAQDSRYNEESLCYRCDRAEKFEAGETLRFPDLYSHWPQFRDGKLFHDEYRPSSLGDPRCKCCFEGWIDEKRDEGKICIKCGRWIKRGEEALRIETKYEGGFRTYHALCDSCLLNGQTIEQWAQEVVGSAK